MQSLGNNFKAFLKFWVTICVVSRNKIETLKVNSQSTNSLNGQHLQVIWPRWEENPKGLSGPIKGKMMLDYLTARFHFTYDFVRVTENWLEPRNKSRGLFDYLWNKEADLLMSSVIPTSERLKVIDVTCGFTYDTFVLLLPSQNDATMNTNAVIKPFQWPVWSLVLVSIVCVTLAFKVTQHYLLTRHQSKSTLKSITDSEHKLGFKTTNPYLYVFGNILSQGGTFTPNRLPVRLVAGAWTLAAFVFVQSYNSTLITYVLAPTNYPLVKSFGDMADNLNIHFLIKKSGTMDNLLSPPFTSEFFKKLRARVDSLTGSRCTLVSECIRQVRPGKTNVFIDARTYQLDAIIERYEETGRCELQLGRDSFMNLVSCFALQKNSPYTATISKGLTELQENGMFNHWDIWFRRIPPKCLPNIRGTANKMPRQGENRRLSLKNLTGAFIVLSVGILISFAVFLFELAYWRTFGRKIRA